MAEPNDHLRRARERTESPQTPGERLSRQELAELANAWVYDQSDRVIELDANYIGKLERGQIRWPQADYRAGIRAVLGMTTDRELGFRRPHRTTRTVDDVDRQEFLRAALGAGAVAVAAHPLAELLVPVEPTSVPSVISRTEIEEIRAAARLFSSWDHHHGGGLVREAVTAQLRYCTELFDAHCPERLRSDLFSAVGFLGHTAGFMAFDGAYAHQDARRMFRFAAACAEEADDWHLRAKVFSSMAHQAIWCGDPDTGLTLVELAMVRADRLAPTERAMLHNTRGRALAKLGRFQEAVAAVGIADEEFSHAGPGHDAAWMHFYNDAGHAGTAGYTLWEVAMRGQFVTEARERLTTAVASYGDNYARSRAMCGVKLASLTMRTGDPHEAAVIGTKAIVDAGAVRSRRMADDLRELRELSSPNQSIAEVAELRHRIGTAVPLL